VYPIKNLLLFAIWLMTMMIFGTVIISWLRMFGVHVPRYNPIVRAVEETADLMLRPIRNAVQTTGGGLDFTPMVAILILYILRIIILRL